MTNSKEVLSQPAVESIKDNPMCPICALYCPEWYLFTHFKMDHTKEELAEVLKVIVIDDYTEEQEELLLLSIKQ